MSKFDRITPSHPEGEISQYRDALNRPQTSVDGPKGHVLVTSTDGRVFDAWHSDRLDALIRRTDYRRAVRVACVAVGLDPQAVTFEA